MLFRLYEDERDSKVIWEESHRIVEVTRGVFKVVLGSEVPLDVPFDTPYWLGISVDGGEEQVPRTVLLPAPYAMTARQVELAPTLNRVYQAGAVINAHAGPVRIDGSGGLVVNGTISANVIVGSTLELQVGSSERALRLESTVTGATSPLLASPNLIGGHSSNSTTGGVRGATISGGGSLSFLLSGGTTANQVFDSYGTVGGGNGNLAGSDDGDTENAIYATVGGGFSNKASGEASTVAGGSGNSAVGEYASVVGGRTNVATGDYSFAGGRNATAAAEGSFVWADSHPEIPFSSTKPNEFAVRATGGVRIVTSLDGASGAELSGVTLSAGGGAWSALSDRNAKRSFRDVSARDVLRKLARIPIQTWNYRTQSESVRHMGPTAQDFHAAFGVGEDPRRISTIDADGVALAAIKGLHEVVQDKEQEIESYAKRVRLLERSNKELERRLRRLESILSPEASDDVEE